MPELGRDDADDCLVLAEPRCLTGEAATRQAFHRARRIDAHSRDGLGGNAVADPCRRACTEEARRVRCTVWLLPARLDALRQDPRRPAPQHLFLSQSAKARA